MSNVTELQRSMMQTLFDAHGDDEIAVCDAYAKAEKDGKVARPKEDRGEFARPETSSMIQIAAPLANDASPDLEKMIGQIYRASPDEARLLSMRLSMSARAQLAVFCNARTLLRDRARATAAACTEVARQLEAGTAGNILFEQATAEEHRDVFLALTAIRS